MAHNICENNRVFTVGKSWHGLGTIVETEQTACNAIKLAKLDYQVQQENIFLKDGIKLDNMAIVRQDTRDILGITTDKYKIVQNVDAFSFFDVVVGEGQAVYHSAGALGKGERIWILAKLPNDIIINKDDVVEKYLCLTNSHDGKSSLRMYFTPVRVVCQNTLNMSMSDAKNGIAIRHSGNIKMKVDEARNVLGISINYYNQFEEIVKRMENVEMQKDSLNSYFDKVLGINDEKETSTRKENQKYDLVRLFEKGRGQQAGNKHSLWKAYNSVTEYVDHERTVKNLSEDASNKLSSIWFGSGAKMKETAYNQAVTLLNVA
jgi:phage/plasmid-like protein (TIGR03299 family)